MTEETGFKSVIGTELCKKLLLLAKLELAAQAFSYHWNIMMYVSSSF